MKVMNDDSIIIIGRKECPCQKLKPKTEENLPAGDTILLTTSIITLT